MAIKLLELAKKIFGPKKVSQQMGTKTGVKLLSGGKNDPFKGIYNVEMLKNNPKALEEAKKQLENNLGYAFSNKNTLELQRFEKNLEAVDAAMNPKSADVIPFKKDEGIMAADAATDIVKKRTKDIAKGDVTGETSDLMKGLEDKMTGIKKAADEMKDIANKSIKNPYRPGGSLDPKIGIVRAAVREILHKNLKAGKIKIPDATEKEAIERYMANKDPIDIFRKTFGENALDVMDAWADDLLIIDRAGGSLNDLNKFLQDKKLFDFVPKKTYGYDQSVVSAEKIRKAKEQEAKNRQILEDFDPPDRTENAHGGLINILKL